MNSIILHMTDVKLIGLYKDDVTLSFPVCIISVILPLQKILYITLTGVTIGYLQVYAIFWNIRLLLHLYRLRCFNFFLAFP